MGVECKMSEKQFDHDDLEKEDDVFNILDLPFNEIRKHKKCDQCMFFDCDLRSEGREMEQVCEVSATWDVSQIEKCGSELICRDCPDPTGTGCSGRVIGIVGYERVTKNPFEKEDKESNGMIGMGAWI